VIAWSEEQLEFKTAVRRFVENEVAPRREELEHGDLAPYGLLRDFYGKFGIGEAALERFELSLVPDGSLAGGAQHRRSAAETLIPNIELARHSPGMVTALGVSTGLSAGAILRAGTEEQKRRWAPDLLCLEKVGAWAITEPDSGSDAFGGMRTMAKPDGDGYVINGSKTFITNGPFADTIVLICKIADGRSARDREVLTVVLDREMPGLACSAPLRKMGLHSSPTGEVFLNDVYVGPERVLRGRQEPTGATQSGSSDFSGV
jgi:alkylation response protein AidB-like acyl-CoA dehydrogenase